MDFVPIFFNIYNIFKKIVFDFHIKIMIIIKIVYVFDTNKFRCGWNQSRVLKSLPVDNYDNYPRASAAKTECGLFLQCRVTCSRASHSHSPTNKSICNSTHTHTHTNTLKTRTHKEREGDRARGERETAAASSWFYYRFCNEINAALVQLKTSN